MTQESRNYRYHYYPSYMNYIHNINIYGFIFRALLRYHFTSQQ